jgi:hypothetical protein
VRARGSGPILTGASGEFFPEVEVFGKHQMYVFARIDDEMAVDHEG